MKTKTFLTKMIDSRNGDIEAHLVLLCAGVAALILLSVYHVAVLRLAFDAEAFGEGLGFLLAGGGAAALGQGLQRSSERNKNNGPYQ
ncbi:MAG: hypothetical protein PHE27_04735 [Alphaproteobacteria bacterium]|nr:hypothetical protein [Alphaproteobacteria bacterium]